MKTAYLEKIWFWSDMPKCFPPIKFHDFLDSHESFSKIMQYFLCVAKDLWACPMFFKLTMWQYLQKGLSYFSYLLHVVTHSWKLQCDHAVLVGYGLACPKFSEITNCQYLWKGLSDFIDFLHVVIYRSYKNMLFWLGIVRHGFSANLIARCFKLK